MYTNTTLDTTHYTLDTTHYKLQTHAFDLSHSHAIWLVERDTLTRACTHTNV
jgi:hypothetical protein